MSYNLPTITRKTALFVIDVQNGFVLPEMDSLVSDIEKIQGFYKHVFISRFYNDKQSNFRKLMKWDRMDKGSDGYALAFEPTEKAVILDKDTYSLPLQKVLGQLEERNIDTLHICGLDTNMCVFMVATDLFQTHKYKPVILADFCYSHSGAQYHNYGLLMLEKAIGKNQIHYGKRQGQ